ncbi:MAG: RagB/SusD family nutrient uptake outer membrane protein [Gemmatimonadetes bacterium]|nr:RagB/SusD family nutrient uptake outer membrane protein [Gemmatimonadota bacterium]
MTKITRYTFALAGALVALGATGCTDTTVEPSSTATETNAFGDLGAYRALLAKVYAGLAVTGQQGPAGNGDIEGIDEGFSQYLRIYWEAQELPTDEAVIGWGDVGLPELNTGEWSSSNPFLVAMYYRVYFQVAMANEFLRQTTDSKLSERNVPSGLRTNIQTFRAEARFLRALSYWHAIDFFGAVPLVKEDALPGSPPPKQATRQEVYDFVVAELEDIKDDLPVASPGTYGRATQGAAHMLLAKVYLNAEVYTGTPQYAAAMTETQAVIAGPYSLDPTWIRLFRTDNKNSPEVIFPIIQDGQTTRTWGGMTFLVHAGCGGNEMQGATYGIDGCWWGYRMKPEAFNRYGAGDNRTSFFWDGQGTGNPQSVAVNSIGDWYSGISAPKFSNLSSTGTPGSNGTHPDTDFPMFRLADAYLMYAELFLRGGGGTQQQALDYVNLLRQRAYGDNSGDITAGQLDLQFVLDERGRELLFEAHRRQDLIRFSQFTGNTYIWAWKNGTQAGSAYPAHLNLYPLPASELVANPNLTQNTGY